MTAKCAFTHSCKLSGEIYFAQKRLEASEARADELEAAVCSLKVRLRHCVTKNDGIGIAKYRATLLEQLTLFT
jgi:hypothetical protein